MKKNKPYTEIHSELITACRKGSRKAQFEIYRLYYKTMYNTALRITGDSLEAEDVMQEAFLKAFTRLDSYRGEVAFGAWLKKIVINRALDAVKLKKAVISLDDSGRKIDLEDDPADEQIPDLTPEQVRSAIMELPEGYRIVLSLFLLEGYDHEEISGILGISNATSRTQYHRARKRLVIRLNELKAVS